MEKFHAYAFKGSHESMASKDANKAQNDKPNKQIYRKHVHNYVDIFIYGHMYVFLQAIKTCGNF